MTPRTRSFGTEPVARLLWHACTQTTMAVGVYGIYALTNAWFVARGVGPVAFAAVNTVLPVLLVIGAVATTVGAGGASLGVFRHERPRLCSGLPPRPPRILAQGGCVSW